MALNFNPLTGQLVVTPEKPEYNKKSQAEATKKVSPTMRGVFTPMGYINPATGQNFSAGTPATGLIDRIGPVDLKNQGRFTLYGFNPNAPAVTPGEYERTYGDFTSTPTPIVTGLTPTGEVDRAQSDEYKSIRAQYDKARKELPAAAARDKGLELWAQANPELAARAEAAKYGTFNPLMQSTFGYQTGEAPDQVQRSMVIGGQRYDVDPEAIQYQIDQQRMQDMDTGNPLMQSEMQQQATADQAAKATTAGMNRSVADRAEEFIEMSKKRFPEQSPVNRQRRRKYSC